MEKLNKWIQIRIHFSMKVANSIVFYLSFLLQHFFFLKSRIKCRIFNQKFPLWFAVLCNKFLMVQSVFEKSLIFPTSPFRICPMLRWLCEIANNYKQLTIIIVVSHRIINIIIQNCYYIWFQCKKKVLPFKCIKIIKSNTIFIKFISESLKF